MSQEQKGSMQEGMAHTSRQLVLSQGMRHFVHGPDGYKYGPADLPMLLQWKAEGRLTPDTLLEPEVGGTPMAAKDLPGLFTLAQQPYVSHGQGGPQHATYPYTPPHSPSVQGMATAGWLIAIASMCLCWCWPVLGPISIYYAYRASANGYQYGKALVVFAVICTLVGAFFGIMSTMLMLGGMR